jgi:hypothetical protein
MSPWPRTPLSAFVKHTRRYRPTLVDTHPLTLLLGAGMEAPVVYQQRFVRSAEEGGVVADRWVDTFVTWYSLPVQALCNDSSTGRKDCKIGWVGDWLGLKLREMCVDGM